MNQKDRIDRAIAVVRDIERAVKNGLFPAFDEETLIRHPILSVRYQSSIQNAVHVYCALESTVTAPQVTHDRENRVEIASPG